MIFILLHFYKSVSNIERASTLNGLALSISLVIDKLEVVIVNHFLIFQSMDSALNLLSQHLME